MWNVFFPNRGRFGKSFHGIAIQLIVCKELIKNISDRNGNRLKIGVSYG